MGRRGAAIERLEALRREGVEMSRNRHFGLFAKPDNRAALSLSRYLDALAEEIVEGDRAGTLALALEREEDAVTLRLARSDLSVQHLARLDPRELAALAERQGVGPVLAEAGYGAEGAEG